MASVLDLGLLQFFRVIFPTILVFVVVYALLGKTKILGGKRPIDSIVAVAAAIFVAISSAAVDLITYIAPWFVVLFLMVIVFLFVFKLMGYTDGDISSVLNHHQYGTAFFWVPIIAGALIVLAGVGATFGTELVGLTGDIQDDGTLDNPGSPELNEYEENLIKTIIHPKIVGTAMLLLICVLAMAMLTGSP